MIWKIATVAFAALAIVLEWMRRRLLDRVFQEVQLRNQIEAQLALYQEKLSWQELSEKKIEGILSSLSSTALHKNSETFFHLAQSVFEKFEVQLGSQLSLRQQHMEGMVEPMKTTLTKLEETLSRHEKQQASSSESLKEQLKQLLEIEHKLQSQTTSLYRALYSPSTRGKWGEIQLRRILELSGMLEHCDFVEQKSHRVSIDEKKRPDVVIMLPMNRFCAIDAKLPLDGYFESMESEQSEEREKHLKNFTKNIRAHVDELHKRRYFELFEGSIELVILFIPIESLFAQALAYDPKLIEDASQKDVVLATPTTLIALLRAIHFGWKQQMLSVEAKKVCETGQKLYRQLQEFHSRWEKVGRMLQGGVEAYNKSLQQWDAKVVRTAEEFREISISDEPFAACHPIEVQVRASSYEKESEEVTSAPEPDTL